MSYFEGLRILFCHGLASMLRQIIWSLYSKLPIHRKSCQDQQVSAHSVTHLQLPLPLCSGCSSLLQSLIAFQCSRKGDRSLSSKRSEESALCKQKGRLVFGGHSGIQGFHFINHTHNACWAFAVVAFIHISRESPWDFLRQRDSETTALLDMQRL